MLNSQFRRARCRIPMNLQFFAETAAGGDGGGEGSGSPQGGQNPSQGQNSAQQQQAPQIDYAKIQQMLDGTLAAKEDTALKAYFKQQGLSQQEAEQAMATFKAEKAKNHPDVGVLQDQLAQSQKATRDALIQSSATMAAVSLGIEPKTIPYVLKMADLSQAMGEDGRISEEVIKNALNKVLEDVPALKPQAAPTSGFRMGASGVGQQTTTNEDALKKAFGL